LGRISNKDAANTMTASRSD